MAKSRFLLDMRPRDAEAPGYHDLNLDTDRLMREFRGEPCLDRLCRKTGMTHGEVRWCPFFGQAVKLGSAYEKDGPDDGQAEAVFG